MQRERIATKVEMADKKRVVTYKEYNCVRSVKEQARSNFRVGALVVGCESPQRLDAQQRISLVDFAPGLVRDR